MDIEDGYYKEPTRNLSPRADEERINEWIRSEIRKQLSEVQANGRRSHRSFLNSPFIVTVVGGLLIALVSGCLQWRSSVLEQRSTELQAKADRAEDNEQAYRDKQLALISSINDKFQTTLALRESLLLTRRWLSENKSKSVARDEFGHTPDAALRYYEDMWKMSVDRPTIPSLLSQVLVLFPDQKANVEVLNSKVAALNRAINLRTNIQHDPGENNEINAALNNLITSMADEIRPKKE